ncbi:MAG: sugar phosphate isomerase/epimerase [Armatimonadetes bacterium]|nr:sugar phosphate isomerase/epimerase [Armatimonadota bacterium]
MPYSITTDYHVDPAVPWALQLRRMRAAGFDRIHWCWDWNANVVYGEAGLARVRDLLTEADLALADTHGAIAGEAREYSVDPAQRAAGLALHRDRLAFTAALGGDVVVLHPPEGRGEELEAATERMVAACLELVPTVRQTGVRLAIENIWPSERNRLVIARLLSAFEPDIMGFCLDSGHANVAGDLDWLIDYAFDRLLAVHLHDNDGSGDQHLLPGDGTVPWDKLTSALRDAGYAKVRNLELSMSARYGGDEEAFLGEAMVRAERLVGCG